MGELVLGHVDPGLGGVLSLNAGSFAFKSLRGVEIGEICDRATLLY